MEKGYSKSEVRLLIRDVELKHAARLKELERQVDTLKAEMAKVVANSEVNKLKQLTNYIGVN
jgi:hypothetical protein